MENLLSGLDPEYHAEMARQAREKLPAFFASANPPEALIMDAAYVCAHAFRQTVRTPRPRPDDPVRHALETVTEHVEQILILVRDALRKLEAYRAIAEVEQARIELRLFE